MHENLTEVRYPTDDRDEDPGNELVIMRGKDGDWFVSVVLRGQRTIGRGVRICTAGGGGASACAPGLAPAIAKAFEAIANATASDITRK